MLDFAAERRSMQRISQQRSGSIISEHTRLQHVELCTALDECDFAARARRGRKLVCTRVSISSARRTRASSHAAEQRRPGRQVRSGGASRVRQACMGAPARARGGRRAVT